MDTTLAFCPAEFFGFDSKNCSCRKHWPEFAKRPEVQEGLRRAKQATVCDGPGKDDEGCSATENLALFQPGASADDGTEIFWMLCPACVVMF